MHDGHPSIELFDKTHIVVNHQYGVAAKKPSNEHRGPAGFPWTHPGGWFVEKQQFGIGGHHHANFQPLLFAMGEFARANIAAVRETDCLKYFFNTFKLFGRMRQPERMPPPAVLLRSDKQIIQDAKAG